MYCDRNFKTKKALRQAVTKGETISVHAPLHGKLPTGWRMEGARAVYPFEAMVADAPEQVPDEFQALARRCGAIIRGLSELPAAPEGAEVVLMADEREKLAG